MNWAADPETHEEHAAAGEGRRGAGGEEAVSIDGSWGGKFKSPNLHCRPYRLNYSDSAVKPKKVSLEAIVAIDFQYKNVIFGTNKKERSFKTFGDNAS